MKHVVLAMFVILAAVGCARSTQGAPDEFPILARWIEDQARGLPRRVAELELDGASPAMQRAVTWVAGADLGGDRWRSPPQITARAERWPGVSSALRNGLLLIDQEHGLVGPTPGLANDDFVLAARLADAENHDRRLTDVLVLSQADVDFARAERYRTAVRTARVALDTAAGGKSWVKPASEAKVSPAPALAR